MASAYCRACRGHYCRLHSRAYCLVPSSGHEHTSLWQQTLRAAADIAPAADTASPQWARQRNRGLVLPPLALRKQCFSLPTENVKDASVSLRIDIDGAGERINKGYELVKWIESSVNEKLVIEQLLLGMGV